LVCIQTMASLECKSSRCENKRQKRPTHVRRDQVCHEVCHGFTTCTENPRLPPRKEIVRKLTINWFSLALRRNHKVQDNVSVCDHLYETKVEVGQDRIAFLHEKVRQSRTTINIVRPLGAPGAREPVGSWSYLHAPDSKRRPGPPVRSAVPN
jgi:hypothetical protein